MDVQHICLLKMGTLKRASSQVQPLWIALTFLCWSLEDSGSFCSQAFVLSGKQAAAAQLLSLTPITSLPLITLTPYPPSMESNRAKSTLSLSSDEHKQAARHQLHYCSV